MAHIECRCPYWTPNLREAVLVARTFKEVGEICVEVIRQMPLGVAELCGPISTGGLGSREKNSFVFAQGIDWLRSEGHNPWSQIPMQPAIVRLWKEWREAGNEDYCMPILTGIYETVFRSGLVKAGHFYPCWQESFGTKWERENMPRYGIEIKEVPIEVYNKFVVESHTAAVA